MEKSAYRVDHGLSADSVVYIDRYLYTRPENEPWASIGICFIILYTCTVDSS